MGICSCSALGHQARQAPLATKPSWQLKESGHHSQLKAGIGTCSLYLKGHHNSQVDER